MNDLGALIWELADSLKLIEKKEVECCGVTPYQGFILMKLLEHNGLAMQDLAKRMNVAVSTMTRNVDKLEEKGVVQRIQATHDARSFEVQLTENGTMVAEQITSSWNDYFNKIKQNMSSDEKEQVQNGMQILIQAIRRTGVCCE